MDTVQREKLIRETMEDLNAASQLIYEAADNLRELGDKTESIQALQHTARKLSRYADTMAQRTFT